MDEENKKLKIEIPVKPISVNNAWQGKRFKTKIYKDYQKQCGWYLNRFYDLNVKNDISIKITVYLQSKTYVQSDVDNFLKPLLDTLVMYKIIKDDRFIKHLVIDKKESESNWIEIEIDNI